MRPAVGGFAARPQGAQRADGCAGGPRPGADPGHQPTDDPRERTVRFQRHGHAGRVLRLPERFAAGDRPARRGRRLRLHPPHEDRARRILCADPVQRGRHDADGPGHRPDHRLPGAGTALDPALRHGGAGLPQNGLRRSRYQVLPAGRIRRRVRGLRHRPDLRRDRLDLLQRHRRRRFERQHCGHHLCL